MIPRSNGIGIQERPQFADTDRVNDFLLNHIALELAQTEPTKGQVEGARQLTGDRFDLSNLGGGEKSTGAPHALRRQDEYRPCPNAHATY